MFPSVNVIIVPAVSDGYGRPACATKSTYSTTCPENANTNSALYFTGINSNVERYFDISLKNRSAIIDVPISFSTPFVYAPLSDQFPSSIVNENLGYVPQTLIEWMAQDSHYVSKFPGIASCLPGGPSVDFSSYFCPSHPPHEAAQPAFVALKGQSHLIVSTTITVAGQGCFHPGACPTTAAPGAPAVAATAEVTPTAEPLQKAGASNAAPTPDRTFSPCQL